MRSWIGRDHGQGLGRNHDPFSKVIEVLIAGCDEKSTTPSSRSSSITFRGAGYRFGI